MSSPPLAKHCSSQGDAQRTPSQGVAQRTRHQTAKHPPLCAPSDVDWLTDAVSPAAEQRQAHLECSFASGRRCRRSHALTEWEGPRFQSAGTWDQALFPVWFMDTREGFMTSQLSAEPPDNMWAARRAGLPIGPVLLPGPNNWKLRLSASEPFWAASSASHAIAPLAIAKHHVACSDTP
jgi:hypothetical protein